MGCFLACFGFHKRRRNRQPLVDGVAIGNQIHLSYEPLDSSSRITSCDADDKLESQNCKPRERPKEQPWVKIRKKVSFNLNIQTYEPIPHDHSDEDLKTEQHHQDIATPRTDSSSLSDTEFTTSNPGNFPQNHRYQNCVDIYDDDDDDNEEDDLAYGESDLEDSEIGEDRDELETSTAQVHSVLKPVENLTQWKAAKAKAKAKAKTGTILKHQMENNVQTPEQTRSSVLLGLNLSLTQSPLKSRLNSILPDTQMQENRVHSSLSDWLSERQKANQSLETNGIV